MYVKVYVKAGAKREELSQSAADHFNISVRQPAEQNLANRRVVQLLALHFRVSPKKVKIINGHHSPSKLISVDKG